MGVSPVEYRNLIRIHTACSLLEGTSMSIEEIAASVGFDSPFYLSRIFKKHIHLSPRQYRQEHQK
jgi:transcriptional regulator GlxA family with amidase domain